MRASLDIQSRRLEGWRTPRIPITGDGVPILPRVGDHILIKGVTLVVGAVVWGYDPNPEIEPQVVVFAVEEPTMEQPVTRPTNDPHY